MAREHGGLWPAPADSAKLPTHTVTRRPLENHGPLGTLWVSLGLMGFYIGLIWVNTLLGIFLTPLFIIPGTWLMDKMGVRRRQKTQSE